MYNVVLLIAFPPVFFYILPFSAGGARLNFSPRAVVRHKKNIKLYSFFLPPRVNHLTTASAI